MKDKKIIIYIAALVLIGLISITISFFLHDKNVDSFNESDNTKEIEIALDNLLKDDTKSKIIEKISTKEKIISLTFQGLSDSDTNKQVLDLIHEYDNKFDFFVSGILAAENSNFVEELDRKGHRIASNTLEQSKKMERYSQEELVEDFVRTNIVFKTIIKKAPTNLMCNNTIYTDDLLKAAYASGNKTVVIPTEYLSYQSFKDYNQVLNYVKNLKKGSIITIKMDGVLEEDEYSKPPEPAKPAIDKQSTVPKDNIVIELTPKERLINMVDWLLRALEETEHKSVLVEDLEFYDNGDLNKEVNKEQIKTNTTKKIKKALWFRKHQSKESAKEPIKGITKEELDEFRKNNNGKKSKEYSTIYTTEKSLSYTFYGVSNIEVLNKVLDNLDILEVKGTFYITKKDLIDTPDTIKRIAEKDHEIGISLKESEDKDFYSTLETILFVQREVNKLTDQTPALVRYPYYLELNDEILEAISSGNCTVLWDNISISSSKVGKDGTLKDVMNNAFRESNISVHRGYVIYYRMDYYNDINIIPDSMLKIAKDRIHTIAYSDEVPDNGSSYSIRPAGDIMNGHKVYNYPLKDEEILHIVKDKIHSGYLLNYSESDKFDLIKNKYIGNPFIGTPNTLPGFTEEELKDVDKTGVFTDDKVLFLTFDDWATDKAINQLLYVLDKHNIKASFFIRTNYIDNNPNLLRAIAEAGHDVGSHTNNHLPFAIAEDTQEEDDTKSIYYSPGEEELLERKKDLLVSYNKLQYIIGDIYMDNRPALNTILRPPTLAMSRSGMEAILDMGFSHIVSGDFSTRDYEDKKPEALVYKIVNGMVTDNGNLMNIQNGSILVLHMSDFKGNPFYDPNLTAKALDMAIPILKSKGYSFARLSDYLR